MFRSGVRGKGEVRIMAGVAGGEQASGLLGHPFAAPLSAGVGVAA
jgi:hypothetical protein